METPDLEALAKQLTAKERLFALAYVGEARRNATRAAEIAGYKSDRRHTLTEIGSRLTTKVNVRAYIDAFFALRSASAQEVLAELTNIALSEWRDHLLIETDPKTGEVVRVRMDLRSKVDALEILAKSHSLLTDKKQVEATLTTTVREYPEGL